MNTTKDLLKKMLSLELGLFAVTRDRVKGVIDELIKLGDVSQEEGRKLIDEFIARGEKDKEQIKGEIEKMMKEYLDTLDVPARQEINELKYEIVQLRKELAADIVEGAPGTAPLHRKNKGM